MGWFERWKYNFWQRWQEFKFRMKNSYKMAEHLTGRDKKDNWKHTRQLFGVNKEDRQ